MSEFKEREAIKTLEKLGYTVKLNKPCVKKTFEIEIELLKKFNDIQAESGLKVKDAINEALSDWIKKR